MAKNDDEQQVHDPYESFGSFWQDFEQNRVIPTVDILGVDVPVPHDVSLGLQHKVFSASGNDYEGMAELMEQMFGEEILEQLVEADITGDQMTIVLAWGVMNGSGQKVSFREAAEIFYRNMEEQEEKKKADPPKKGSSSRKSSTPSRRTGATSSRTSGGTTRSGRKTSPK